MSDATSPAHVLFPADAPAAATPTAGPTAAEAQPARQDTPTDTSKLFPSEVVHEDRDGALERLDTLADAVRLDGDAERADALTEASDMLLAEARAHGMPTADLREIVDQVHAASATVAPMTEAQLADLNAKTMREIEDIPAADLNLARGLITAMSAKMPDLIYQLEATGLGSDPKFIRAVVREAKRRAGR